MSITVATAVVAPSALSSVTAPAAPAAGAGDLAFQALLETFSSVLAAGGEPLPPSTRAWTDRATLTGPMPADVAGTSAGTARTRTNAPLETDGRSAQPSDSSDQAATLGNPLVLQVLPLPAPASLPAVDASAVAGDSAPARLSGPSIAAPDTQDRSRTSGAATASKTPSTVQSAIDVRIATNQPAIDVDRNAAATASLETSREAAVVTVEQRIVPMSSSLTSAYGANPAGESTAARSAVSVTENSNGHDAFLTLDRRAARSAVSVTEDSSRALGQSQGSNIPSPQAVSTDPQKGTTAGPPAGPKGPALRPADANEPDRLGTRTDSIPPAIAAAESGRPGPLGPGIDVQFEARSPGAQAARMPGSSTPADLGAPTSPDQGPAATVTPRDQAAILTSPPATTPTENPTVGAADRRSAAGVRLAAALARGARAEGPAGAGRANGSPGAGLASGPDRVAAQATTMSAEPDLRNISTSGAAVVNARADRLADRMRSEVISSTFGTAASAAEQMPLRVAAAENMPIVVEPASDIKASGLAAVFAAPVGGIGVGLSSSHAVQAAVATTPHSALDPAAESDLPRQIVQAMRLQWKDGIGDARIRLLPDYLGELSVAIRVEHGTVMAALEASTSAVRQWIESHEPMLRQSLAEHGLHLDRLIVSDEPQQTSLNRERRREKGEETQQEQQPHPRRRPPADDTTFEVIV